MIIDFGKYRQPTNYQDLFKYVSPEGYHWVCGKDDFGRVIWGGWKLENNYDLAKD